MSKQAGILYDTKEVIKYYDGPFISTYFITEEMPYFKITKGFSCDGKLFDTQVIYKNKFGRPYMFYEQVDQTPGFYRRVNSEGVHSDDGYWTFHDCMLHPGENLI